MFLSQKMHKAIFLRRIFIRFLFVSISTRLLCSASDFAVIDQITFLQYLVKSKEKK